MKGYCIMYIFSNSLKFLFYAQMKHYVLASVPACYTRTAINNLFWICKCTIVSVPATQIQLSANIPTQQEVEEKGKHSQSEHKLYFHRNIWTYVIKQL